MNALIDASDPGDLVTRIEVQPRLLAVPYVGALIRRLCRPADTARPSTAETESLDALVASVVNLVERTIVEGARRDGTAPVRIDLFGGAQPRLVIVMGVAPTSPLGQELSHRAVASGRAASVVSLDDALAVVYPLPASSVATRPEIRRP